MSYNFSLLSHLRAISECLPKFEARAELRFDTMQLEVRARGRYYEFTPQYAAMRDGKIAYTYILQPEITNFIGWRHYFHKHWQISTDKVDFKHYCVENGLLTPPIFFNGRDVMTDVLIKQKRSAFSEGIRGPFRRQDANLMTEPLRDGDYFEGFVIGEIAKAWFWDGRLACLELKSMSRITSDGVNTVRDLIDKNVGSPYLSIDWTSIETLIRYQGLALTEVAPQGREILVDFRYVSGMQRSNLDNHNVLASRRGTPMVQQLEQAGPIFWRGIPDQMRYNTLFTIDAIVDSNQRVWFLEMNSNPVVHPDSYVFMFEGLFGSQIVPAERPGPIAVPGMPRPQPVQIAPGIRVGVIGPDGR